MKKFLSLLLALVMCLSLCACYAGSANTPAETTTQKVEDDGILKILLIGHSLGIDSSFMFRSWRRPDKARISRSVRSSRVPRWRIRARRASTMSISVRSGNSGI